MLEIRNAENLDKVKLKIKKRKCKKTQILLYDTHRRIDDFFMMLKYRNNGKYADIPHFCIDKLGNVYKIFDPELASTTFDNPKIDNSQIKIAIENLGWLNKNTITGILFNWINNPYRSEPYIKSWRNYYYWDRYTDEQLICISQLCFNLCTQYNIPYKSINTSAYTNGIEKFDGIVSKSNFSDIYTDINPSFNYNIFEEYAKQTNLGV